MFDVQTWLVFVYSKYQEFWVANDIWGANSSTVTSHCKPSDIWFKLEWEGLVEEATQCANCHAALWVFFLLTARKWSFQDPCLHRLLSLFLNWTSPYNGVICLETLSYSILENGRDVTALVAVKTKNSAIN